MGVIQLRGFITPFIFLLVLSFASASFFGDEKVIILEGLSGGVDLRTTNNLWNGTQQFDEDVTFNAEVDGTKVLIQTGRTGTYLLDTAGTQAGYMRMLDNLAQGTSRGQYIGKAGSIAGFTVQYDVVSKVGTGVPILRARVLINNSASPPLAQQVCSTTVASKIHCNIVFNRDTYNFGSEDELYMEFFLQSLGAPMQVTLQATEWQTWVYIDE